MKHFGACPYWKIINFGTVTVTFHNKPFLHAEYVKTFLMSFEKIGNNNQIAVRAIAFGVLPAVCFVYNSMLL